MSFMNFMVQKKHKHGASLIEALTVFAIIAVLLGIVAFSLSSKDDILNDDCLNLMRTLHAALEVYSLDFGGRYPPDTLREDVIRIDGEPLLNSSQALCYFLGSDCFAADGRITGAYHIFSPEQILQQPDIQTDEDVVCQRSGRKMHIWLGFVIDPFGGPLVYDERLSEQSGDGLHPRGFVLVSGGSNDINPQVGIDSVDGGNFSAFGEKAVKRFDITADDYRTNNHRSITHDDILNEW